MKFKNAKTVMNLMEKMNLSKEGKKWPLAFTLKTKVGVKEIYK